MLVLDSRSMTFQGCELMEVCRKQTKASDMNSDESGNTVGRDQVQIRESRKTELGDRICQSVSVIRAGAATELINDNKRIGSGRLHTR